jgi:SpoVK/Ycf46/Vps4 family AAA+-type ATPase
VLRSGRFDEKIVVPLPNSEDRTAIFARYIGDDNSRLFRKINAAPLTTIDSDTEPGTYIYADDIEPSILANLTDDFSCADIKEVLRRTKRIKLMLELKTGNPSNVTQADIAHTIAAFKRER